MDGGGSKDRYSRTHYVRVSPISHLSLHVNPKLLTVTPKPFKPQALPEPQKQVN